MSKTYTLEEIKKMKSKTDIDFLIKLQRKILWSNQYLILIYHI